MNDRLVTTCISILSTLSSAGTGVNKIIQKTSSDRTHVIEAIKTLEKGKLVSHERWSPGTVKLIKPTTLGIEIKDLLDSLKLYRESFKKFQDKNRLKESDGTNVVEREIFQKWQDGLRYIDSICKKNIFLALAHRYSLIYYKHELNQIGNTILIKIISNEFSYQLSEKGNPRAKKIYKHGSLLDLFLNPLSEAITYDILCAYTSDFYISSCNLMSRQAKDLMIAFLRIAKISKYALIHSINLTDNHDLTTKDLEKLRDQDYAEYLYEILKRRSYVQYGPYEESANSNDLRLKDRKELTSIFKSLLPASGS